MNKLFDDNSPYLPLDPDSGFFPEDEHRAEPAHLFSDEQPLCADMPYPPAEANCQNERYAALIRGSFCGKESELTAVMSCIYHGLAFYKNCPELAKALIGIALCEMRHLILLGRLLLSLGGDPKFFCRLPTNSNMGGWWSAQPMTIGYCDSIDAALKNGIAAEKAAIAEYKSISKYADDEGIRAVLNRIIADEELHIETLECFYSRFCG